MAEINVLYTRECTKRDDIEVINRPLFESHSGVPSSVILRASRKTSSLGLDPSAAERGSSLAQCWPSWVLDTVAPLRWHCASCPCCRGMPCGPEGPGFCKYPGWVIGLAYSDLFFTQPVVRTSSSTSFLLLFIALPSHLLAWFLQNMWEAEPSATCLFSAPD